MSACCCGRLSGVPPHPHPHSHAHSRDPHSPSASTTFASTFNQISASSYSAIDQQVYNNRPPISNNQHQPPHHEPPPETANLHITMIKNASIRGKQKTLSKHDRRHPNRVREGDEGRGGRGGHRLGRRAMTNIFLLADFSSEQSLTVSGPQVSMARK